MSWDRYRQDSLIMRESHFKNLNPSELANRMHRVLAVEIGPIIATAIMRRASDRCEVPLDRLGRADVAVLLPSVMQGLQIYRTVADRCRIIEEQLAVLGGESD